MVEELGTCEEQLTVQLEDLVQFRGYIATNNVLDAYAC